VNFANSRSQWSARRWDAVPTLIFHVVADEPVPVTITTDLEQALNALHGTVKTVIRPGIRHEGRYLFNSPKTLEFFAQHQRRQISARRQSRRAAGIRAD
jgi:dipeptidyl aminopeptidase/acylaminoacyl peptidase